VGGPGLAVGSTKKTAYCGTGPFVTACHGTGGGHSISLSPFKGFTIGATFGRSIKLW